MQTELDKVSDLNVTGFDSWIAEVDIFLKLEGGGDSTCYEAPYADLYLGFVPPVEAAAFVATKGKYIGKLQ